MVSRSDNRPVLDLRDDEWRRELLLIGHAATVGERQQLARLADAGELARVRRGVYRIGAEPVGAAARHLALVRALVASGRNDVVGFRSAAAVWGLPRLDPWPDRVDVVVPASAPRRSTIGLRRHITDVPYSASDVAGIRVTALVRTAVDVARVDGVASAVTTLDAVLAGIRLEQGEIRPSRDDLLDELARLGRRPGTAAARFAIGFADGRSESPGESLSRTQMHRLRLTAPLLQHRFDDAEGSIYPDFYWPDFDVAGEFDGAAKYFVDADPASVRASLIREKRREDRLRAQVRRVVRWDWATARDRVRLDAVLRAAGVR